MACAGTKNASVSGTNSFIPLFSNNRVVQINCLFNASFDFKFTVVFAFICPIHFNFKFTVVFAFICPIHFTNVVSLTLGLDD